MNSEIKVYSYPNGEIQKVQVVRWDDWSGLDFLRPTYSPLSLKCFGDIYENFLVPARPEIFGQLVMVQMPEDMEVVWGEIRTYDDDWHKKYSGIAGALTVITLMLQQGVKLVGGKPHFVTEEAKCLWEELQKRDCLRIVRGKLPHTQVIPVGNFAGYLSEAEPQAKMKVNASFFIMDPIDCATVYDQIGAVIGLNVKDGVVTNPPMYDREAFLVDRKGQAFIRSMNVSDLEVELNEVRYKHGENAYIYTRPKKKRFRLSAKDAMALVIVGNRVVDVKDKGMIDIPTSGFVMVVKKTTISVGDEVIYRGLEDIQFGIQVGNSIIRDGLKTDRFISQFYNIYHLEPVPYPPSLYPMDFDKARAARIALGADEDGKPMLFWAEGAAKFGYEPGKGSCGASLSEMAEIAADIGMKNGINLDGGGSAQILLNGQRTLEISDRKKEDYSEAERLIPLGLVVR